MLTNSFLLDDAFKALPGEERNMVLIPCWMEEDPRCALLQSLGDALLHRMGQLHTQPVRARCETCRARCMCT